MAIAADIEVKKTMAEIRHKASTTQDRSAQIISGASAGISEAAAAKLPPNKNMRQSIQYIRRQDQNFPALPNNLENLVLPDEFKQTLEGEEFLKYDSGPGKLRILIFATYENLQLLSQSTDWFGDGTFKTVPLIFQQLYTLHALHNGYVIPVIFALLPNKTKATYDHFLQLSRHWELSTQEL